MLARKTPSATRPRPQSSGCCSARGRASFVRRFLTRDGLFGRSLLLRFWRGIDVPPSLRGVDDLHETPLRRQRGADDVEPLDARAGAQVVARPICEERELDAQQVV